MVSNTNEENSGVFVGGISVLVDGTDVMNTDTTQAALIRAEVETAFEIPDMCVLTFNDPDYAIMDAATFDVGKSLKVKIAGRNDNALQDLFDGEIVSLEPTFDTGTMPRFVVRAYDKRHRLNRGTAINAYQDQTDADLFGRVAGEAGFSAQKDTTSITHDHVMQHNQSNLSFINELARINGYQVYTDGRNLGFKKADTSRGQEITLRFGDELFYFKPRISLAGQVDKVQVKGWDAKQKQSILGEATSSSVNPTIGQSGWGGSIAKSKFGQAVQMEVRHPVSSQNHAQKVAQAMLDEINSGFVQAEGTAYGSAGLVAGARLKIERVGSKFGGKYLVTTARHIYEQGRYVVDFTVSGSRAETTADLLSDTAVVASEIDRWTGVFPAMVTNIDDPEDRGRVKVKFPWLDDNTESFWVRVMQVGGGPETGIYWMPEVDDEVLVAFGHGDFNSPYVLGGLFNGKDKVPDAKAIKNGKVEVRTIKTRAGHIIRLTDKSGEEKIEIIDSKQKNTFTMDTANQKIIVTTTGNLEVTADGDATMTVKGKAQVDVTGSTTVNSKGSVTVDSKGSATVKAAQSVTVQGMSVTVKASSSLSLQGATVSIQGSGNVSIKGAMVAIN